MSTIECMDIVAGLLLITVIIGVAGLPVWVIIAFVVQAGRNRRRAFQTADLLAYQQRQYMLTGTYYDPAADPAYPVERMPSVAEQEEMQRRFYQRGY